jgi:ADP-ribosylglycohydrolase
VPTADRARGALYGLAIGDALGMPTQLLSRRQITDRWGPLLTGFEPAPPGHPIAAGLPPGAVTDDTEQAVLLARMLVKGHGTLDPRDWAEALITWERDMAARGSLDLLGPSTTRALAAVLSGAPPEESGRRGDTNGAAMRITPVGIAFAASRRPAADVATRGLPVPVARAVEAGPDAGPSATAGRLLAANAVTCDDDGLPALVDHVVEASRVTHNTSVALAGAAAVAAAVSAGVGGASLPEAVDAGVAAARLAASRGHWVAGADVAARIRWAIGLLGDAEPDRAADLIATLVGTSLATQESIPAAFAVLSVVPGDPWQACLLAASLGGDTDTIAAIAGAIAGACHGESAFPVDAIATIDAHGFALPALADALLALRSQ